MEILIYMKDSNKVNKYSSVQSKIALFRSLFRGREDGFPLRFESKRALENGYFVLHFLTEDVGKYLAEILDAILRTIANRKVIFQRS